MKNHILGIIAEYNPFHNGHLWQIQKAKEQFAGAAVITLMSGNFTQRGCPALLDKWSRAKMAVLGGADLVLELPFLSACKSAEFFAQGAVQILQATNIVSHLCFGAETNDLKTLNKMAVLSAHPDFALQIKRELKAGVSYTAASQAAMKNFFNKVPSDILKPNNILAIEYLKALFLTKANIQPVVLPRKEAQHLDLAIKGKIASATAIRQNICTQGVNDLVLQAMPETSSLEVLKHFELGKAFCRYAVFEKLLLYRLRQLESVQMKELADLSEGLENRIKKAADNSRNISELLEQTVSRRYPQPRVMRSFCQLLVLNKNMQNYLFKPYFRVLAFNNTGRQLIKKIRSSTVFPLITNLPDIYSRSEELAIKQSLDADINATDVYQILIGSNESGLDFKTKPFYVDK